MQMCVRRVSARTDEVMAKHWSVNPLLAGHGAAAHSEIKQLLSFVVCFHAHGCHVTGVKHKPGSIWLLLT